MEGIGRRSICPSADIRKMLPERSRDSCLEMGAGMPFFSIRVAETVLERRLIISRYRAS